MPELPETYLSIKAPTEGVLTVQRSRFLAYAHPIQTTEQARELVKQYTASHHSARHVCWAYVLGADRSVSLSTDNGEPSGTAGKPILGQINSRNLTNLIVIVVRYFGGVKLGTPGLIAAYKESTGLALDAATIVEYKPQSVLEISFGYESTNDVMKLVKKYQLIEDAQLKVLAQDFDLRCRIELQMAHSAADQLYSLFEKIEGSEIQRVDL